MRAPQVLRVGLVGLQAVDVHSGDVDVGSAGHNPVRERTPEPAAGEDADRVEPGGHEVVLHLGRLTDDRLQVRGEALRPAEQLLQSHLHRDRYSLHRGFEVWAHAFPVRRDLAEGEVVGDAADVPRRADRLEHPEHQAAALLPEVAVRRRVLEDGPGVRDLGDPLGDQVVVLRCLERDVHPVPGPELAGPHPRAVDDVLGLDVAVRRAHAGHRPATREHLRDRDAFDDRRPGQAGTLGQRHGDVDRVGSTVLGDVEAREDVVGARQRKELADFSRRDLVHIDPAITVERGHPSVLLQPVLVGCDLDETDRHEAG